MEKSGKDRVWLRDYEIDITLIKERRVAICYKGNDFFKPEEMSEHDKQRLFTKLPAIFKEIHKRGLTQDTTLDRWTREYRNFIRDVIRDGKSEWEIVY